MMNQMQNLYNQPNQQNQMVNDQMYVQAQNMLQNTNNPKSLVMDVAQQKGISMDQLQQMASQFGIKL